MHNITHLQYVQAIQALRPNVGFSIDGEDYSSLKFVDDTVVKPTEQEIATKHNEISLEYNNAEYQRNRVKEYPSFSDQFDLLYHGGYDTWKAAIDEVKTTYPKPE